MPAVQKTAGVIAGDDSERELAIVTRWLGDAHHYGKV
jgi:hypothetical protein